MRMQEKVIDNKNRLIVKSSSTWIKYRKIETLGILSAYLVLLVGVTILDRRNFLKDLVLLCVLLCLIMPLWLWMVWNEGRTVFIDKNGCTIEFLSLYKKTYPWSKIGVRQLRSKIGGWEYEGVLFSASKSKKTLASHKCTEYLLKHPLSSFVVNFEGKHNRMTLGRPFFYDSVEKPSPFVKTIHGEITAVDKEIFLKKMKEWNVKLETERSIDNNNYLFGKKAIKTKEVEGQWKLIMVGIEVVLIVVLIKLYFLGKNMALSLAVSPILFIITTIYVYLKQLKGYSLIMDEKGCAQRFLFLSKHYSWKNLRVKLVASEESHCGEGVLFIKKKSGKSGNSSSTSETFSYASLHPYSSFVANFEVPGKMYGEKDALHEISKELFLEKMKEWGVEVEGLPKEE